MRLVELEPAFYKLDAVNDRLHHRVATPAEADAIMFLCPKCLVENNGGNVGVHSIMCLRPHVRPDLLPGPGRWEFQGTGYADLSLVAGSSSVLLTSGCRAHFFVRAGAIVFT